MLNVSTTPDPIEGHSDVCQTCRDVLVSVTYADATPEQSAHYGRMIAFLAEAWSNPRTLLVIIADDSQHIQRHCETCGDDRTCVMYDAMLESYV